MTTKDKILQTLEENKGKSLSGESLAENLGISRAAVWKAINELRKEGYKIEAITNKGYCLSTENDVLSAQGIIPYLNNPENADKIHVYKQLESTNITLKKMAMDGAPSETLVIAEEQTKGRGRMGRSFYSPPKGGIYMSILLKPYLDLSKSVLITTAASVAVCRAIEKVAHITPEIKWVNDVYLNQKKICGILTEAVTDIENGHIQHIILGIGVNFTTAKEEFPSELSHIAGSLNVEGITRNQLAAEIYNQMIKINENLESKEILSDYKAHSMVLGKEIRIYKAGTAPAGLHAEDREESQNYTIATALDIGANGGLIVKYENGEQATLSSAEISIRF